jgi:hypothetical protein
MTPAWRHELGTAYKVTRKQLAVRHIHVNIWALEYDDDDDDDDNDDESVLIY